MVNLGLNVVHLGVELSNNSRWEAFKVKTRHSEPWCGVVLTNAMRYQGEGTP